MAFKRTAKQVQEWRKGMTYAQAIGIAMQKGADESMRRLGEKAVRTVIQHIELQDLNWTPLRNSTKERKGHAKAWIDSGKLKQNIFATTEASTGFFKNRITLTGVGVRTGVTYDDGREIAAVAKVLEEGGRTEHAYIHKRPLFAPSAKEVEKWHLIYNRPSDIAKKLMELV